MKIPLKDKTYLHSSPFALIIPDSADLLNYFTLLKYLQPKIIFGLILFQSWIKVGCLLF